MQTSSPLERVTKDIEKLEKKIENAEKERINAKDQLNATTSEFEYKKAKDLLDSATQELHDLREKEGKLIEERRIYANNEKSQERQLFQLKGRVEGSKTQKGVRKSLYRFSQNHCAFYHFPVAAFEYEGDDLVVDVLFESRQDALNFQTEFEFLSTNIAFYQLKTESEVIPAGNARIGNRIFLKDYESTDFDSPDDSIFSASEFTTYQPTDDLTVYQSLEKLDFLQFGCEGAHLVSHRVCQKRKWISLDRSENNRLALSRQMHGYVDGLSNGRRPVVGLHYVSSDETLTDGRYRVMVGVQCLDNNVKQLVEPLLKQGTESTANPLIFRCPVFVRDKEEFIESLKFKSNETQDLWIELGLI